MLRFRGSPALSPFRLEKLLTALRRQVPAATEIYAEFVHFVDGRLITHDREVLDRLLQYGPTATQRHLTSEPTFLVVPRPGTRSPWSSKATDIAPRIGPAWDDYRQVAYLEPSFGIGIEHVVVVAAHGFALFLPHRF